MQWAVFAMSFADRNARVLARVLAVAKVLGCFGPKKRFCLATGRLPGGGCYMGVYDFPWIVSGLHRD